jgi:hypothetical protein
MRLGDPADPTTHLSLPITFSAEQISQFAEAIDWARRL